MIDEGRWKMALFVMGAALVTLQAPWWLKASVWLIAAGLQWHSSHLSTSREYTRRTSALVLALLAVLLFALRYNQATPEVLQRYLVDQVDQPLLGFAQEVGANGLTLYTKDLLLGQHDKDQSAPRRWLKIKLAVYDASPSWEGQWLSVDQWRLLPIDQVNQGSFSMVGFALGRGFNGAAKASQKAITILPVDAVRASDMSLDLPLEVRWRSWLKQRVAGRLEALEETSRRWLNTLLFGVLDAQQAQTVKALGVLHLCVVSGCHYTLLLGAAHHLITGRLGSRHRTLVADAGTSLALLWVAASGFGSDRAYAKAQFSALSFMLKRRLGGHRGMLALLSTWLLLWPTAIHQVGFQITFAASATLLLWRQGRWRWRRISMPMLLESALESLAVTAVILPILLLHFPNQPMLQVLATVLLTPVVSGAMLLGAVYLLFGYGPVGGALALLLEGLCSGLEQLMLWMVPSSVATIAVPYTLAWLWALLALMALWLSFWPRGLAVWLCRQPTYVKALAPSGLVAIILGALLLSRVDYGLSLRTFALKDGESYLIRAPGAVVLYDVGNDPMLVTLLKRAGVTHIDRVVISHPHQDHNGLLSEIQKYFKVDQVISGAVEKSMRIGALDIRLASPSAQAQIEDKSDEMPNTNPNETSIALAGHYRNRHFLLTGDLEEKGLAWLMSTFWRGNPPDLFKASHHGSYVAAYPEMLSTLKPTHVWISGGRGKRVNKAPLKRELHRQGVSFYDTMEHGELYWGVAPESLVEVVQRVIQGFLRGHTKWSA